MRALFLLAIVPNEYFFFAMVRGPMALPLCFNVHLWGGGKEKIKL